MIYGHEVNAPNDLHVVTIIGKKNQVATWTTSTRVAAIATARGWLRDHPLYDHAIVTTYSEPHRKGSSVLLQVNR